MRCPRLPLLPVAALLLALVAAAGCKGDDDDTTKAPEPTPAEATPTPAEATPTPAEGDDDDATECDVANFCVDIYVLALPIDGEDTMLQSGPVRETGTNQFGEAFERFVDLGLPVAQVGANGFGELTANENFDGAAGLRTTLARLMTQSSTAFAECCVSFSVGKTYFIDPNRAKINDTQTLAPWLKTDADLDQQYIDGAHEETIGGKKMSLLDAFQAAVARQAANRNCLKLLYGPFQRANNELGVAQEPGDHAAVDGGSALNPRNSGFIVAHELGHLLGLSHPATPRPAGDRRHDAMSATTPPTTGLPRAPRVLPADCAAITTNIQGRSRPGSATPGGP